MRSLCHIEFTAVGCRRSGVSTIEPRSIYTLVTLNCNKTSGRDAIIVDLTISDKEDTAGDDIPR